MDNKKIGDFISERRKHLGLTQQRLADQLSVSNKAISKWETGEGYPEITTIPDLCNVLSISTDEFFVGRVLDGCPNKGCIEHNSSYCNNREISSNSNFIDIAKITRESKFLQEIKFVTPYFIFLIILYYILPVFWNDFLESDYIYLSAFPIVCVTCGIIYTIKHSFSLILGLGAGILFLPTMALYMDGRDKEAIMYAVLYCITVLFASFITLFLKKRYSMSISITAISKSEKIQ